MKASFPLVVLLACCALVLSANRAYAYLDPGSGSMLIQALFAALAAVAVSLGAFRRRLRSFFSRVFGHKKVGGHNPDEN